MKYKVGNEVKIINDRYVEDKFGEGYNKTYIDHDHITGQNRGILCCRCNTGLGKFEDDINLLQFAINYLRRYQNVENKKE